MEEKIKPQLQEKLLTACPVCGSSVLQKVIELRQIPVLANVLWDHREEAISCPRGDVYLVYCGQCGHVFNQAYDPASMIYDVQYENSLHFSPTFQNYASSLANYLIDQYNLRGKTIVEIGSGKGDFLRMLCEIGGNVGTGFDPSFDPAPEDVHPYMSFVKDLYSERYADYQADLICARHTLEHIYQPAEFAQTLRRTVGNRKRTVIFIEVPNLSYILRDTAIWDIIYEHFSYFSPQSLSNLFSRNGFNILNLAEAYQGQFLYIEAIPRDLDRTAPNAPYSISMEALTQQVENFGHRSQAKMEEWRERVSLLHTSGKRAVLWGAGSKGISLLNMLHIQDEVEYIVDINPRKTNKYITGAGQQIVQPEFLKEYRPDTIIIMNPIYKQEIQSQVEDLGISAEYMIA